jgi:MFS transporter, DHA3 family, macrolide efflux protein
VFRKRDLYLVSAARFISRTGGEASFFVGIWGKAAYQLQATPSQIAVVMLAASLSGIVGGLIAGVLVDRFDPRKVLIAGEALFVPVVLSLIFANSIPALVVAAALRGLVGTPIFTAVASMAPFMTEDPAELNHINSWLEGAGSAAFVMGPAAGALITSIANINWVFAFDAVTSLVAVLLVWPIHLRRPAALQQQERRSGLAELREGLRVSYSTRSLRYLILMGTGMWLAFGAFGALEPLFYRDVLETGVQTIGWVNAIFGAGLVFGAFLLPRLPGKVVSFRGAAVFAVLTGLGAMLYVGTADLRVVVVGSVIWGTIIGAAEPLMRTLIQSDSPDELVGRIAGTMMVHHQAGELLPLAVAPGLAALYGVQPVLIAGGILLAIAAAVTFGEAAAIDRTARLRTPVVAGAIAVEDEPISPTA